MAPTRQKLILDTDIGDDIDDALALGLICRCPEVELLGVSTVFGNTTARARQARTVLAAAGADYRNIPVAVGCERPMSPHPFSDRGMGDMGDCSHVPNQDGTCLAEKDLAPLDRRHGADLLIETIMSHAPGEVIPVTIGAMTNMALALVKERKLAGHLKKILVMAGEFRAPFAEWNVRCDPEAAAVVFGSGVAIDLIPWHVGYVVTFAPADVDRLEAAGGDLPKRLHAAIGAWQSAGHHGSNNKPMPNLYDPMTIVSFIRPELCQWRTGRVKVELRGESTYGFTTFRADENGPHRVAWDADRDASIGFYLDRVTA